MKNKQFPVEITRKSVLFRVLILFTVIGIMTFSACPASSETTSVIFLVRHAEKTTPAEDPGLTEEGRQRAGKLSAMLAEAGIKQIHSTDFNRTRETAGPLAKRLGLDILLYDPSLPEELAEKLKTSGGRHLVVGHSNTVPDLVEHLGGEGGTAIDEPEEHDRLYIVTLVADGTASTLLLRYGEHYSP
jgi:broad specificity phosphatase PhoE